MWWECGNCVAGGNSAKSQHKHEKDYPSHHVTVIVDDGPEGS